jgi:hypothetical protein
MQCDAPIRPSSDAARPKTGQTDANTPRSLLRPAGCFLLASSIACLVGIWVCLLPGLAGWSAGPRVVVQASTICLAASNDAVLRTRLVFSPSFSSPLGSGDMRELQATSCASHLVIVTISHEPTSHDGTPAIPPQDPHPSTSARSESDDRRQPTTDVAHHGTTTTGHATFLVSRTFASRQQQQH